MSDEASVGVALLRGIELNLGREYTVLLHDGQQDQQWDEFLDPWSEVRDLYRANVLCETCGHGWIWHTKIGMCWFGVLEGTILQVRVVRGTGSASVGRGYGRSRIASSKRASPMGYNGGKSLHGTE